MSWIDVIAPEHATGELREVYATLAAQRGKVANILQVHSLRPRALVAHVDLYMDLMFAGGPLSRRERELMAVAVSLANGCAYCVAHHREALARYVQDAAFLDGACSGALPATATARELALYGYARKLTREPAGMRETDLAPLRDAGLGDDAILLANLVTAYFNFVNRIALGLGVPMSDEEVSGYRV